MDLADSVWRSMKKWRSIRIGPASLIFRFRRTTVVSANTQALAVPLLHIVSEPATGDGIPPIGVASQTEGEVGDSASTIAVNQVAAIFGVGPGLGFALARRLVREGMKVALVSRQAKNLAILAQELNRRGAPNAARIYSCDATDERSVEATMKLVRLEMGVPALVVYSIQRFCPGRSVDTELDAFEDSWRHNCLGGFVVAREAARAMKRLGRGSIILIGSTSGVVGRADHLNLAVGKFGLRAVSHVMSRELWQDGIHVAHVIIDADVAEGEGIAVEYPQSNPEDISDVIYSVHMQPRSAWSSEIDVRPWNERFWEHC